MAVTGRSHWRAGSMEADLLCGIDAVVLDAGGVLLLPDPAALRCRLAPFGVAPDDTACVRAHSVGMAVLDALGAATYAEADRAMARLFGIGEHEVDRAGSAIEAVYREEPFVPAPGVGAHLRRLQAAGTLLAVVSNATGQVEAELAGHGVCAVGERAAADGLAQVAVVIDSHRVGIEKPDPAIFALAIEALGIEPDRCLYVGDSVHFDVNGAAAAGLRPVHVSVLAECAGAHLHVSGIDAFVDAFLGAREAPLGG